MLEKYIKIAKSGNEFTNQADKYFVNMSNNMRTLHITGCKSCQYSTYAYRFITFSAIQEVENFEKSHMYDTPFRKCRNCFR